MVKDDPNGHGAQPSDKLLTRRGYDRSPADAPHHLRQVATISADALRHMSARRSYFSPQQHRGCRIGEVLEGYESNALPACSTRLNGIRGS